MSDVSIPNYTVTPDEQRQLYQRRMNAAQARLAESDRAFEKLAQLGAAFRALVGASGE